jgi:hypothetical protein
VLWQLPSAAIAVQVDAGASYRPSGYLAADNITGVTFHLDANNNDLSEGLTGWIRNVQNDLNVGIEEHSEASVPPVACPPSVCIVRQTDTVASTSNPTINSSSDLDLAVNTHNLVGWVTSTRQFTVAPGTQQVTVRYRFQSVEPLPQWTHSPQNDAFYVQLHSAAANYVSWDSQTVSSLSLGGLFDQNGATAWRTLTLPISVEGDTVTLTVEAANAGDAAGDSWILVDAITEQGGQFSKVSLLDLRDPS